MFLEVVSERRWVQRNTKKHKYSIIFIPFRLIIAFSVISSQSSSSETSGLQHFHRRCAIVKHNAFTTHWLSQPLIRVPAKKLLVTLSKATIPKTKIPNTVLPNVTLHNKLRNEQGPNSELLGLIEHFEATLEIEWLRNLSLACTTNKFIVPNQQFMSRVNYMFIVNDRGNFGQWYLAQRQTVNNNEHQ